MQREISGSTLFILYSYSILYILYCPGGEPKVTKQQKITAATQARPEGSRASVQWECVSPTHKWET